MLVGDVRRATAGAGTSCMLSGGSQPSLAEANSAK
jgi:hypothetical protein